MADFIETNPTPDQAVEQAPRVTLKNDWVLAHLARIDADIRVQQMPTDAVLHSEIGQMDTVGALLLRDMLAQNNASVDMVDGLSDAQRSLLQLVSEAGQAAPTPEPVMSRLDQTVKQIGRATVAAWETTLDLLRFIGETVVRIGIVIRHPGRLRGVSLVRHLRETGLNAIPIVALIAFLISVVLAYQGANQLQRFGAQIFTINMVAVSVMREMGVLLTAIMIAGRSGSAFTAEIGVMKVNEEIDAMRIIGVQPFELLVLPRLLALVIAMPLLTFIADLMGILGGGLISETLLGIGFEHYLDRVRVAVKMKDFWVGMIKAPVFGLFIGMVGCMRGLQVSGSAESVGRLTTISVVQSIFLVLLLDALFSILFTKLGL